MLTGELYEFRGQGRNKSTQQIKTAWIMTEAGKTVMFDSKYDAMYYSNYEVSLGSFHPGCSRPARLLTGPANPSWLLKLSKKFLIRL